MKTGDTFDASGYDMVASAVCESGYWRACVLCNNSSHYIVALLPPADSDDQEAVFDRSYPYYDQPDNLRFVYSQALTAMAELAMNY